MIRLTGWMARAGALLNNDSKGPWGSGGNGDDGDSGGGPRNPWQFPPQGRRPRGVTSLDDFLKRARGGGGGNGSGGGGGGFSAPGGSAIWLLGVGVLVALWIVLTSFHQIGPQQEGVVTFFGRYSKTLKPGVQMTLPAPLNRVQKVDVSEIRYENFPADNQPNLMLTNDQNIVDLTYQVRWSVRNPQDYVFQIAKPRETVRGVAESAMREVVAEASLNQVITSGRDAIQAKVQQRMQELLDSYQSGIVIEGVSINDASPPKQVEEAFKRVTAAQQQAETNLYNARAYAQQVIAAAQGQAVAFDKIYAQYKLAPEVTRRRLYYETMEAVLAQNDKTVVEPKGTATYLPLPPAAKQAGNSDITVTGNKGGQDQ